MDALRPLFAVFFLTAACSSTSDLGTNAQPGSPDASPDSNADAAPNSIADSAPDTIPDTAPNSIADATPDTIADAAPDTIADARPDAIADAAPDVIVDAGPDTNGIGTLSGILGGKFVLNSGYGHMNDDGSIDVILSDFADACASAVANRAHAGETFLQAYGLRGTAPGVFASTQVVKYATEGGSCPSGQRASFAVVTYAQATVSKVTLSKVTASAVEGEMSATFNDGSHVSGTFTVPTCSSVLSEFVLCY
jgi:hypothetical protein